MLNSFTNLRHEAQMITGDLKHSTIGNLAYFLSLLTYVVH